MSNPYFNNNQSLLDMVIAHELGHSISMTHPPNGFEGGIMDITSQNSVVYSAYSPRSLHEMGLK